MAACENAQVAERLSRMRRSLLHIMRAPLSTGPVMSDSGAVHEYLKLALSHRPIETVLLLLLNSRNELLGEVTVATGSVDQVLISPREILRRALLANATAMIVVHNHPSGDPTPSRADRELTCAIGRAAKALDIVLHDHLVVGREAVISFRALGYL